MEYKAFVNRVFEAAEKAGIAPAEIAYSRGESFSVRVRQSKLQDYEVSEGISLTLRGVYGGRIGTSSTQAIDEESIDMLVQGVKESAALIETDEQDKILPPDPAYGEVKNYEPELENVTAQQKIDLAMKIDDLMQHQDARITPDDTVVSSAAETFCLMNTLGLNLEHRSNMIYAYTGALAKEGGKAATDNQIRWGYSLSAIDPEELAACCCKQTLEKLEAGNMSSGPVKVVIKNTAMADFLKTFCGVFSADNAQKGLSLLAGREGEKAASDVVTLTDDPLMAWGLGSCPFDREGAAAKTKNIIENGVLTTLLHNRKTAKKAGVETTGNAGGAGHVSPSNLFIVPGDRTLEELFAEMGDGLYLTEISGLHAGANPISGDFSLLSRGCEVKDGRIVRQVEQFTVSGNFYQLLKDIERVGADLKFEASSIGAPSVLAASLNVAGAQ